MIVRVQETRNGKKKRQKKGFRFETSWLLNDSCEQVLRGAWDRAAGQTTVERLEEVAGSLMGWSAEKFDDLGKKIDDTEKALKAAQQLPVTPKFCEECNGLEKRLDDLHSKHEAYWYMRSRVAEVKDRDRNTKYFHHKASQRKSRNKILGLLDDEENWQEDEDKIEMIVTNYYNTLFSSSLPTDECYNVVLQHVPRVITSEHNAKLL